MKVKGKHERENGGKRNLLKVSGDIFQFSYCLFSLLTRLSHTKFIYLLYVYFCTSFNIPNRFEVCPMKGSRILGTSCCIISSRAQTRISDTFWRVCGLIGGFNDSNRNISLGVENNDNGSIIKTRFKKILKVTFLNNIPYSVIHRHY